MNNALATFLAGWLKRRQDLAMKRKQRAIAVSTVLLSVGRYGQLCGHLCADLHGLVADKPFDCALLTP